MSTTIEEISAAVEKGKAKLIKELVPKAIEEGCSAQEILNDGLLHGMGIVATVLPVMKRSYLRCS